MAKVGPEVTARDVVTVLEEVARKAPDNIAVDGLTRTVTYRELWQVSGQRALALVQRGVQRGDVCIVDVDSAIERVLCLVAVLRAGGAFCAVTADVPDRRWQQMVELARPVVQIRSGATTTRAGVESLRVEEMTSAPARPLHEPTPDDIACVFFTSGTTGVPRGVPLPHSGIARLFGPGTPMPMGPGRRMACMANVMFDAATLEVWGPLLQGATVVEVPRTAVLDPQTLRRVLEERRIDTLFLTTALLRQMCRRDAAMFAGLDGLYTGGEALDPATVRAVLHAGAPRRFWNLYGPTETTTLATARDLRRPLGAAVPIGSPVPGTAVQVLTAEGEAVPDGEVGQLFVSGLGVSPGYLGEPATSQGHFLSDPAAPGGRIYRTGDLVRWQDDELLFVGRADRQVKVRGFRVELGEVEEHLTRCEGVEGAFADVERLANGQERLVAAVSGDPGLTGETVRTKLRETVPSYLVPDRVIVKQAGLTANGKVDRPALRAALGASPPQDSRAVPTATDALSRVLGAWRAVLGRDDVQADDTFFEAGGTSLLLLELQAELEDGFGQPVAVADLVSAPTPRRQVELLVGAAAHEEQVREPEVEAQRLARHRRLAVMSDLHEAHDG